MQIRSTYHTPKLPRISRQSAVKRSDGYHVEVERPRIGLALAGGMAVGAALGAYAGANSGIVPGLVGGFAAVAPGGLSGYMLGSATGGSLKLRAAHKLGLLGMQGGFLTAGVMAALNSGTNHAIAYAVMGAMTGAGMSLLMSDL